MLMSLGLPAISVAATLDELKSTLEALTRQMRAIQGAATRMSAADSSSAASVCTIARAGFGRGRSGSDITKLQSFLVSTGYLSAAPTGYFGLQTQSALARYQLNQKLIASLEGGGYFGNLTWRHIYEHTCTTTASVSCKPLTYMAMACKDGTASVAERDAAGCITGYRCPNDPYMPPSGCIEWSDGCNICHRDNDASSAVCSANTCATRTAGICKYYLVTNSGNIPPIIQSVAGPLSIANGQSGTWSFVAKDSDNANLTYSVDWGDRAIQGAAVSADQTVAAGQVAEFTHTYSVSGAYAITFIAQDPSGGISRSTALVKVGAVDALCALDYTPVCGQPSEPACRKSIPACMIATPGPTTYTNRCFMDTAGASLLYTGVCASSATACTAEVRQCPDGTYVGRSGPLCAFASCPTAVTSCTTASGSTVANGQTATGFCADGTMSSLCTGIKVCQSGQWTYQSGDPAGIARCRVWTGNCSTCTRSSYGGPYSCAASQCDSYNGASGMFCSTYF
jgi:peptidoglycan hydrolase-like protein with peptidoglycan-binding domain